jgi:hypothetical protein
MSYIQQIYLLELFTDNKSVSKLTNEENFGNFRDLPLPVSVETQNTLFLFKYNNEMHNFKIKKHGFLSWGFSVPSGKDRDRTFNQVTVTFFHILKHPLFTVIQMPDAMASLSY